MWAYKTLASGTADSEAFITANAGLLLGAVFMSEDAAGTAGVKVYDGATISGGTAVCGKSLAANEIATIWLGEGINCPNGITLDRTSGTTTITVAYRIA